MSIGFIALSSNGRTADSDSVNLGSNPGKAANKMPPVREVFCWLLCHWEKQSSESQSPPEISAAVKMTGVSPSIQTKQLDLEELRFLM